MKKITAQQIHVGWRVEIKDTFVVASKEAAIELINREGLTIDWMASNSTKLFAGGKKK